jgi:hypothetical protein
MKKLLRRAALAALFYCAGVPAFAQNPGQVTNHAYLIGKGAGTTGYTSLLCASAQLAVGQASADPICQTITGDVTINAGGVSAIGAGKVVNAMLGADVFSTAHSWSGAQTFASPILNTPTINNPALSGTVSGSATYSGAQTFSQTVTLGNGLNSAVALTVQNGGGAQGFVAGWMCINGSYAACNGTPFGNFVVQSAATIGGGLTLTGGFAATGQVTYIDMASGAIATAAQYMAGTGSLLVQAGTVYPSQQAITFGATTTLDFSTFINASISLTGNITGMNVANVMAGKAGQILFIQDATGGRTTVWSSIFKWASGAAPSLSTAPNAVDALEYNCSLTTFCVATLVKDVR